jgi:heme A synthase
MSVSEKPLPPRSRNLTIIAVLLGVIGLLSLIGLLTSGVRIGQPAFPQGVQPGNMVPRSDFQPGNGNFQPGSGNFQQRGSQGGLFSLFGATRSLGINFQYVRYVSMGIAIIGIVLTLVAAYFAWKQKRWALNLAVVLAILFLLGSLPGLFTLGGRFISWLPTSLNVLKALASIPIIVLGILPSVRDSVR